MRGLLIKDALMLKKYVKTILAIIVFYFFFGIADGNPYFFSGISGVLCVMMVITSFSYDSYAKWDKYGASLPVTRRDMVKEKYLFALLLLAAGTLISFLMVAAFFMIKSNADLSEMLLSQLGTILAGLLIVIFTLPCIYKYGVEKARIVLLLFAVIAVAAVMFAVKISGIDTEKMLTAAAFAAVFLAAAGYVASYFISCRIFEGKEL